ncbi:unnamed protein product [Darwinula stevensoni]|uniref:RRM domain-containing protein n=1 Tax=Darwinula stevensoni TaxID=69355 RepID=A0A7R9A099_9CRUS|nr:unnamed protein product [Darwinula stevensoni]CAG0884181.1 unnamed protein product [Darwinula stevensoni]
MNRGEPRSRGVGRGGMGRGFGRGTYRVTSPEGSVHDVAVNRPKSRRRDLEGLFVTGKLYVRNVPCNNQDEIRIMFENFGELTNFFVFASRYETEDGQPLSDALVQYKTFREAEDALRNLHNCEPYFLDIEFAITDQEKAEGYTSGEDDSVIPTILWREEDVISVDIVVRRNVGIVTQFGIAPLNARPGTGHSIRSSVVLYRKS